jgi:hypothetical protein
MSCTGQTITLIPFARVAARTASRPGTAGAVALAALATVPAAGPYNERKLLKNEVKRFFIEVQSFGFTTVTMGAPTVQCKGGGNPTKPGCDPI